MDKSIPAAESAASQRNSPATTPMIRICLYAAKRQEALTQLENSLASSFPLDRKEFFQDINELCRHLQKFSRAARIAVFLIAKPAELERLLVRRPLLEHVPIILILPDDRHETVAMAHLLRPRFLTGADNCSDRVIRVLEKMAARLRCFSLEKPAADFPLNQAADGKEL